MIAFLHSKSTRALEHAVHAIMFIFLSFFSSSFLCVFLFVFISFTTHSKTESPLHYITYTITVYPSFCRYNQIKEAEKATSKCWNQVKRKMLITQPIFGVCIKWKSRKFSKLMRMHDGWHKLWQSKQFVSLLALFEWCSFDCLALIIITWI